MTTMITELYKALIAANVNEDQARAAAEAVADIDKRTIDLKLESIRGDVREVRAELFYLRWIGLAIFAAIVIRGLIDWLV